MPYCPSCGAEANAKAIVCVKCGVGLTPTGSAQSGPMSDKQWVVALLLCFFLGCFGVHRFYLGHTGIGVAQLLTLGGCGIWALIDFILILIDGVKDAQGLPLKK